MSNVPFAPHKYDPVPIGRNVVPIPECKVVQALQDGKVINVVDVPILSCSSVWLRCQQEAEKWISDCDGEIMHTHPELINARINAAYAYLWLTDHRFQWAGLAAFASKQVGCGLLHSSEMIQRASVSGSIAVVDKFAGKGAQHMKKQLAIANRSLFLDVYPLHRFYTLRGIGGIRKCLDDRQLIRVKVKWEVAGKLPFGQPFKEIRAAFEAIERGDIAESVRQMAWHEQINVLQPVIYNDLPTRALLDGNQAAWVIGFPSGFYEEVQLTLSAQCKPKSNLFTSAFRRSLAVKLYDPEDRMKFVYLAADNFDKLLRKHHSDVEHSLKAIYLGHGVK